jgi:hypothetical protein
VSEPHILVSNITHFLLYVGINFELLEQNFRATEPPDMTFMPVFIGKGDGTLANPVTFWVTPLTVQEAEARRIRNFTRPVDDSVSPSIAGMK